MSCTVLVGSQWGDEGKGKIIDVLTEDVDVVVRFQGGNNAGHTVEIGEEHFVLHLIPSGIFREGTKCVVGNGVVVDPVAIMTEIDGLQERGLSVDGRLFISDRAHVVFPYHKALDAGREESKAEGKKIGTTRRGIGPAYSDKITRTGLRMGDLLSDDFRDKLSARLAESNKLLSAVGAPELDEGCLEEYLSASESLKPFITDTVPMLHAALAEGKSLLFEGAQGTMLDIDFGTYPFVTSSNATSGGACTGSGVPPNRIDRVVGVVKAYTTRVGEGPFTTELTDDIGKHIGEVGHEFGATTGRPRRCGWFDGVVARYAAMVNGIDFWAMTKLDVLDQIETLKICVAYECNGKRYETPPGDIAILAECKPVYEEMDGWMTSTKEVTKLEDLPPNARAYVDRLCEITGVKLGILSVGPRRASTLRIAL
jgi:adenylosuccinate synthase